MTETKQEEKLPQYRRMKLFNCRGISGLQAKPFQKPSEERGDPAFPPLPQNAPCRSTNFFCNSSLCTLEWVR